MVRRSSRDDDDEALDDEIEDDEELHDEDDDFEEVVVHGDGGGLRLFLSGLMLGAILGAGTVFLTAPARGEVTRRRLKRRMRRAGDDARTQIGEWRDDAQRNLDRRRKRVRKRLRRRG
jgi:hypothetical protein